TMQYTAEQGFLVAEGGIQAGTVDAHGPGEVRQGRAFVAFLPEYLEGALQDFVFVEFAGTSPHSGGFLEFHTHRYNNWLTRRCPCFIYLPIDTNIGTQTDGSIAKGYDELQKTLRTSRSSHGRIQRHRRRHRKTSGRRRRGRGRQLRLQQSRRRSRRCRDRKRRREGDCRAGQCNKARGDQTLICRDEE